MDLDERRFYQEIRQAEPDDVEMRLVFADWLEERGDMRCEMIRVQCELHSLPQDVEEMDDATLERMKALKARNEELKEQFEQEWGGRLSPYVEKYRFNLGLIEYVEVSARKLATHRDAVMALAPIRLMNVTHVNHHSAVRSGSLAEALLAKPAKPKSDISHGQWGLERLTGLAISKSRLETADIEAIVALLEGSDIQRFVASNCGIDDQVLAPIETLENSQVQELDLSYNRLRNGGAQSIANSVGLGSLESLDISSNQIRFLGARALARSTCLAMLSLIVVRGNPMEARAIKELRTRMEVRI